MFQQMKYFAKTVFSNRDLMDDLKIKPILVLGCGVAGLAASRKIASAGASFFTLEREDGPGGLVRTDKVGDYQFDRAGHFIHTYSKEFSDVIKQCGLEFNSFDRISAVIMGDRIVPYPLQFNLWACKNSFASKVAVELESLGSDQSCENELLENLRGTWGESLTSEFFQPYLEKMWGDSLSNIPANWGSRFVPKKDMAKVRQGMVSQQGLVSGYGYNAKFVYPASGRVSDFSEILAVGLNDSLIFDSEVVKVDSASKMVTLADGTSFEYSRLISTIPLNNLLDLLGRKNSSGYLAYSNLLNVRVGFKGELNCNHHWLYLPDQSVTAFRVGFPTNFSKHTCPDGSHSLSLEYGLGARCKPTVSAEEVAREALDYLSELGVLRCDEIELVDSHLIQPAYVAHRMSVTPYLQSLNDELEAEQIFLAGRYGAWDYTSLEDAYLSGTAAAEKALSNLGQVPVTKVNTA